MVNTYSIIALKAFTKPAYAQDSYKKVQNLHMPRTFKNPDNFWELSGKPCRGVVQSCTLNHLGLCMNCAFHSLKPVEILVMSRFVAFKQ